MSEEALVAEGSRPPTALGTEGSASRAPSQLASDGAGEGAAPAEEIINPPVRPLDNQMSKTMLTDQQGETDERGLLHGDGMGRFKVRGSFRFSLQSTVS